MKTVKLILVITLMSVLQLNAQNVPTLDINGLEVGGSYTDAQMRAALGGNVHYYQSDSDSIFGEWRTYHIGDDQGYDVFRYSDQNGFNSFVLKTPNYTIYNGRLKVGDDISKANFSWGVFESKGSNKYRFSPMSGGVSVGYWLDIYTNSANKIERIVLFVPS